MSAEDFMSALTHETSGLGYNRAFQQSLDYVRFQGLKASLV